MTTQTPSTEERLSRLEGAYEQVSERLGDLSRGQDNLRSDINALREEMQRGQESLREEMQRGQEALRAEMQRGQEALREEMRLGQDSLRAEMQRGQEALRADIRSFRGNMLLLMGGAWATMIGGFIAIATLF